MKSKKLISTLPLMFLFLSLFLCWNNQKSLANSNNFELDFNHEIGNWKDLVGTSLLEQKNNQLFIQNTTIGKNIESISLASDSPLLNDGEVELTFLYENQKNFGVVFRADATQSSNWQSFAYNGDGNWQLGQPGGKWLTSIKSPPLVPGETYRLLVRYSGKSIEAFLNGHSFYRNEHVVYPNGNETISDDWTGQVGLRLFGDRITLRVLSLKNGAVGSIPLSPDNPEKSEDLAAIRSKWKENLVGDFEKTPELLNDAEVQTYIQQLSNQATTLYDSLDKSTQRTRLWSKKASDTNSADLTTQFKNIAILAKAYGTKETKYYHQQEILTQIISALDFMTTDELYSGKKYFGNWWDWQVGVPQEFLTSLFILYEDIPKEKISHYATIMSHYLPNAYQQLYGKPQDTSVDLSFIPNFVTTGANRTDLAFSVLGIHTLAENPVGIKSAVSSVNDVFKVVTKGDGFYPDGSFIQHNDIPYTGSYGNVLIKGVGKIFSLVKNTAWETDQTTVNEFVQNVEKAFIPLLVNGEMMPMVNGRSISRAPAETKTGFGSATLYNLLIVSEFANPENQQKLKEATNYWMQKNIPYYYHNTRDFKDLLLTKELLADKTISFDKKPFIGSYLYGAMDRFVYSNEQLNLGISLYSNRTSSFEAGNKENKKGWHMSDGMLYLFNSDQQFGAAYWPTVDPYRLPGTTVDTIPLKDEISSFTTVKSKENYVGGVTDTKNSVVSMNLNKDGTKNNGVLLPMNVKGKKTWFVIDGKIIALGTAISGTTSATIETIVENRMLDSTSHYELTNQDQQLVGNQQTQLKKGEWLLLSSDKPNQNLGYLMLEDQLVKTDLETREGTYQQLNDAFPSSKQYREAYQKIIINHGSTVNNGSYAYLLFPDATAAELKKVTTEDAFTILENTEAVQAIQNNQSNLIGATVWSDNGAKVDGYTVDKPASFLVQQNEKRLSINLSNPKQTSEKITLSLPTKIEEVISSSEAIQVAEDGHSITVDTTGGLGKTFTIKLRIN